MAEAPDVAAALQGWKTQVERHKFKAEQYARQLDDRWACVVAQTNALIEENAVLKAQLAEEKEAHVLTQSEFARHMEQWNEMRAQLAEAQLAQALAERSERITELEDALLGAGLLYGFECRDGLPCWCEPDERTGPHAARCAELRAVLERPWLGRGPH